MKQSLSPLLNVMHKAARSAGKFLVRDFGELEMIQSSKRGTNSFALKSAQHCEKKLIDELSKAKPECSIFKIENNNYEQVHSGSPREKLRFVIIPIDGFNNFMHSIPLFSTIIAAEMVSHNKTEVMAILVDVPIMREYYHAEKGNGAWKNVYIDANSNSIRMRVSHRNTKEEIIGISSTNLNIKTLNFDADSIEFAYLASAKVDLLIKEENNLINDLFDLMILESGGKKEVIHDKTVYNNSSLKTDLIKSLF